mmetsp:Transcript_11212/g.35719  ORF Transcript_11212/g.35719 Transcript_11212/m.35719 type:complete len:226 (+) Transcript_11212:269-946(+)
MTRGWWRWCTRGICRTRTGTSRGGTAGDSWCSRWRRRRRGWWWRGTTRSRTATERSFSRTSPGSACPRPPAGPGRATCTTPSTSAPSTGSCSAPTPTTGRSRSSTRGSSRTLLGWTATAPRGCWWRCTRRGTTATRRTRARARACGRPWSRCCSRTASTPSSAAMCTRTSARCASRAGSQTRRAWWRSTWATAATGRAQPAPGSARSPRGPPTGRPPSATGCCTW